MIGLERGVVRLVPYDPDWPEAFAAEARRLRAALADKLGAIEHIGSTAVAAMPAKPIIDMMAVAATLAAGRDLLPAVERLGYELRPKDDVPDRLFFARRDAAGRTTFHLSLTPPGSDFWRKQIRFRDYLREHADARRAYLHLKRDLAGRHPADRGAYVDAKTDFVKDVLARAARAQA